MGRWKYLPHTVFGLSEVREREAPGAAARAAAEHFSARLVPAGSHPHPPGAGGAEGGARPRAGAQDPGLLVIGWPWCRVNPLCAALA